jgi:hypothetical protein
VAADFSCSAKDRAASSSASARLDGRDEAIDETGTRAFMAVAWDTGRSVIDTHITVLPL